MFNNLLKIAQLLNTRIKTRTQVSGIIPHGFVPLHLPSVGLSVYLSFVGMRNKGRKLSRGFGLTPKD